jgi:hypothetical protein
METGMHLISQKNKFQEPDIPEILPEAHTSGKFPEPHIPEILPEGHTSGAPWLILR